MRAVSHESLAKPIQLFVSVATRIALGQAAQCDDMVDFETSVADANDTFIADRPDRRVKSQRPLPDPIADIATSYGT